ncbi:hypothetical protein [Streptomonospora salina]|uniref:Uncharacterized protein n=1 Tax=Streptomonospora salina TaxID=104205 RepID=A0A841EIW8_9ACTN|nr:hypothetical protein [Streptomonospora salina]MBB5999361.1 hypothetical protein [Streptomonospora salina]
MSNGLRHFLGLLAGILAVPVLAVGLAWAPHWSAEAGLLNHDLAAVVPGPSWLVPVSVLATVGLLLGLLTGSRLSPLAALVPGLVLGAAGFAETADLPRPVPAVADLLTVDWPGEQPWFPWGPVFAVVGAALVVSALPPSRWRSRDGDEFDDDPYDGSSTTAARSGGDSAPPEGTGTTQTMSPDADGMPPRYHVSDPRDRQPQQPGPPPAAGPSGWNDPHRPDAGDPRGSPSPRWQDRG